MLARITGKIEKISPTSLWLEVAGIGVVYQVEITIPTFEAIKEAKTTTLFTYLYFKKEANSFSGVDLYGFISEKEKQVFELLISVSGIGPNTARIMLSAMSYNLVAQLIVEERVSDLAKIKGIGPKTVQRMILELKEKMSKQFVENLPENPLDIQNKFKEDALLALVQLGYQKSIVSKTLDAIDRNHPDEVNSSEFYIKMALKML
ncbi:MAG: Holliday junction branch migration protein RuvA [Chitinophagales bacterium]|nr:Holliday junction branch migration protein RuvA [Chitinophagales bacterium]